MPCGLMKGVLHSDADPKVAARLTSDPDDPKLSLACMPCTTCPPAPPGPPGSRWRGRALPELCRERRTGGTGVLRGLMKGLAFGLCGREPCRGDIGWKLKCRFRVPGKCSKFGIGVVALSFIKSEYIAWFASS